MKSTVGDNLDTRWDATLVKRVVTLRIASSLAGALVALSLPSLGYRQLGLALVLLVGIPTTTLLAYRLLATGRVLMIASIIDSVWMAVIVGLYPGLYVEIALVSLAVLAFIANENHRALVVAAAINVSGLLLAGLAHNPNDWTLLLIVYVLLLPLLLFVSSVQRERDIRHLLKMRHRIEHDGLTGLRNRIGLTSAMASARATAVIAIDLDGFKDINDTLGHEAGDELLVALARRLEKAVGVHGVLARVGGDEFAVAVTDGDPELIASDLVQACRQRVALGDIDVSVGASVGISEAEDAIDGAEMLRRADLAMYEAKRNQGGVSRWSDTTRSASWARVSLSGEVESAFDEEQFSLHYQPIVSSATGAVVDVEGLLRWNHPELGVLRPGEFLQLVEGTGRRSSMDRVVFDAAARAAHELPPTVGVSVNVSAGSLLRSSLPTALDAALLRHDIDPRRFTVEVIEDELLDEHSIARDVLGALGEMGVGISIDDFGTGHSSLSRLRHLPVTSLKIDRSFVAAVPRSDDDRAIVRAVADLGRALDLLVVAEGVENEAVIGALGSPDLRIDRFQGWGIAAPMPLDSLLDWIEPSATDTLSQRS